VELKQSIYRIFQCKDKRTAQRRYAQVMGMCKEYMAQKPEVAQVFDTMEHHWPKLVNGMESKVIPKTSNAVELVIRRFDQHYQNFCGFESVETAHRFLAVFELVYRFTPSPRTTRRTRCGHLTNALAANAHWNWPGARCASCPSHRYAGADFSTGPLKP